MFHHLLFPTTHFRKNSTDQLSIEGIQRAGPCPIWLFLHGTNVDMGILILSRSITFCRFDIVEYVRRLPYVKKRSRGVVNYENSCKIIFCSRSHTHTIQHHTWHHTCNTQAPLLPLVRTLKRPSHVQFDHHRHWNEPELAGRKSAPWPYTATSLPRASST